MADPVILKDPDEVLKKGIDWSDWLPTGITISSAAWTISGPDSDLTEDSTVETDTVATIQLSGGTATDGLTYKVTCQITASNSEIGERSFYVQMLNR